MSTFALIVLLVTGVARADGEKQVQFEATGEESDVEALRVSLVEWLKPFRFELRRVPALPEGADPEVYARVRVQWRSEDCLVEVFTPDGALVRRKALPRGGAPLLLSETAALVAHAAIQELTLLERRRVLVSTDPAPPPDVELASPAPPETPPVEVSVAAWFQGRSWNEQQPVLFGAGAEVAVSLPIAPFRPAASLLVSYTGPFTASTVASNLQLQSVAFRGLIGAKRRFGAYVELEAGLGGGLDLNIADASSTTIPAEYTRDRVDPSGFFTAALGVRFHPSPSSGVLLRVLLDADPARRRYLERVGTDTTLITVPWAVRPTVQLGFAFDLVRAP